MAWVFLLGAITFEVTATLSLRAASMGRKSWYGVVACGYLTAFVSLSLALDAGLDLGVGYGVWIAAGITAAAIACKWLFDDPLTPVMMLGIALIAVGVLLVELGTAH